MRRHSRAGGDAVKARRRKTVKRQNAAKAMARRSSSASGFHKKVELLRRELNEAHQQQAATADVLKVMSRSTFDLQSVLYILAESAARLCEADLANIWRPHGSVYRLAAAHQTVKSSANDYLRDLSIEPSRDTCVGRTLLESRIVHIHDILDDPDYTLTTSKLEGVRTMLGVPLLREGMPVGVIALVRSTRRPFTAQQIQLVTTFAAQAVIAIENTRLLNELRQSLEQQTATGEILASIGGSMTDAKPVFDAIVRNLLRLFGTRFAVVQVLHDGIIHMPAADGQPGFERLVDRYPRPIDASTVGGQAMLTKRIVQFSPIIGNPEAPAATQEFARDFGFNSVIFAPMARGENVFGAIGVAQHEPRAFEDKQIALIKSFADQAVIAIENARLFDEVQKRTSELSKALEQQTTTADILGVISKSLSDTQPVFDAIVQSGVRLFSGAAVSIALVEDGMVKAAAVAERDPMRAELWRKRFPFPLTREYMHSVAILDRKILDIPDVENASAEMAVGRKNFLGTGYRAATFVPLMRGETAIGALSVVRISTGPLSEEQLAALKTYADQAVIAVENARLINELRQRTTDLTQSLENLRTAQDRLVQTEKLASLGQLTAGIAHEIKNPLNFVNNFSGVSVELIDELRTALGSAHLDAKLRAEIGEIADTLQGNLDKVVQHGKRADAIVKNMLLHSRQGSGEHRSVDINALVEESLNLAYHGARAEKQSLEITLERSFDPTAGEVDLFPQEITRVLLNLIANAFYAATKRKAEVDGDGYEPTLTTATKNLGDRVEISIRDNGTGIPPEVKEKLFSPFFTTKPAGEGTGLGLSISHDIIVKQHGGSIEVDTKPGEFTEFRIVLPRTGASLIKSGEHASH